MRSCMRAYATVQKLICLKTIANLSSLVRASCRLSLAARPTAVSTKPVVRRCLLKKSVQIIWTDFLSTLAHDAVAAAVLHKHHSIIRVGAGLIQFVYGSHSLWATGITSSRILFWPFFRWRRDKQDSMGKQGAWQGVGRGASRAYVRQCLSTGGGGV